MVSAEQITETFIRYAKVATGSDPDSTSNPSTQCQFDLARILVDELKALGVHDVKLSKHCVVTGHLPPTGPAEAFTDVVLLNAHMDTSFECKTDGVEPIIHHYTGGDIALPRDGTVIPAVDLERYVNEDIITSSGDTLLGGDDKAGIAQIVELLREFQADPTLTHPGLFIMFTPDEEVGRGTEHVDVTQLVVPGCGPVTCGYTIDSSHLGEVEDNTFTAFKATITMTGCQVHPGMAFGIMKNSITAMGHFLSLLPTDHAPETTKDAEPYVMAHRVTCDVPKSEVQLILRAFNDEDMDCMKKYVTDAVAATRAHPHHGQVAITDPVFKSQYRNMHSVIAKHGRVWDNLVSAASAALGHPVHSIPMRGGTDGAMMAAQGLPVPNVWGGGVNFHSVREFVPVVSMVKGVEMLIRLCEEFKA